jgi:hypothetical protein
MDSLMSGKGIQLREAELCEAKLREANRMMQRMLAAITNSSSVEHAAHIRQLRETLRTIREEGFLDAMAERSPALSQEVKTYRDNLQKLQKTIPAAKIGLKIKQAGLEQSRSHKEAVSDWFRAQEMLGSARR